MAARRGWRRRLAAAALVIVGLVLSLEAYTRWPSSAAAAPLVVAPGTRELVLIVHGSFGRDEPGLRALERRFRELAVAQPEVQVVRHGWSPASDNILRAAPRGDAIGARLGAGLAAAPQLVRLHLVAHSAGAYLLDPLCEAWRGARGASPALEVRMTFLDPIGLRGLFDRGWGARELGRCADVAVAYINTDDAAPATDRRLRHARTVDVTAARVAAGHRGDGHRWPIEYYRERLSADGLAAADR
jgi:hypothetical protein